MANVENVIIDLCYELKAIQNMYASTCKMQNWGKPALAKSQKNNMGYSCVCVFVSIVFFTLLLLPVVRALFSISQSSTMTIVKSEANERNGWEMQKLIFHSSSYD